MSGVLIVSEIKKRALFEPKRLGEQIKDGDVAGWGLGEHVVLMGRNSNAHCTRFWQRK
jgi:hypothetical protein